MPRSLDALPPLMSDGIFEARPWRRIGVRGCEEPRLASRRTQRSSAGAAESAIESLWSRHDRGMVPFKPEALLLLKRDAITCMDSIADDIQCQSAGTIAHSKSDTGLRLKQSVLLLQVELKVAGFRFLLDEVIGSQMILIGWAGTLPEGA